MTEITIIIPTWGVWVILFMLLIGAGLTAAQAYLTRQLTKLERKTFELELRNSGED